MVLIQEVDGVLTLPSVTVTPAFSLSTATWSAQFYSHLEEKESMLTEREEDKHSSFTPANDYKLNVVAGIESTSRDLKCM